MNKVLIGMSGGVDSSVAAALLIKQGYDVTGVTFKLWNPEEDETQTQKTCCSIDDINDARYICNKLNIPHYVFNFKKVFKETVVDYFVDEYINGKTPNPCVMCNKSIKFKYFFQRAMQMGFDFIATGHYARINKINGHYSLNKAVYTKKDQSYFLYNIPYEHLSKTIFPLGEYDKPTVRKLAQDLGFKEISKKKDSQEICFVDSKGYVNFIENYTNTSSPKGNFVDINGKILGQHKGAWNYTIGQRKGLGISFEKPMYVVAINTKTNDIVISEENHIFSDYLIASNLNWILPCEPKFPLKISVKIRNQAALAPAVIEKIDQNNIKVIFDEKQRAITKGQSVVFYDQERVLGGGTIM